MAGIGFVLNKLAKRGDLLGVTQAFLHAGMVAAGPWILTVLALSTVYSIGAEFTDIEQMVEFRVILSWNIGLSLVLSSPIFMLITRYVADHVHMKDIRHISAVYSGGILILMIMQMPFAYWFYVFFCYGMEPVLRFFAAINYLLMSCVWLTTVLMTSLKSYKTVSLVFLISLFCVVIFVPFFGSSYGVAGMLFGFNAGMLIVVVGLSAQIFRQYGYKNTNAILHWIVFFKRYCLLALNGLLFNAAVWSDKWVLWAFAPEHEVSRHGIRFFSVYDGAMFLSYLSVIPALALFVFSMETNFFARYSRFYRELLNSASYAKIVENQNNMISGIITQARSFLVFQACITLVILFNASKIFEILQINFLQMGMFRLGLIGAFFSVMVSFALILLAYFDEQRGVLKLSLFYLMSNVSLTYFTIPFGFAFYGIGYVAASILTFLVIVIYLASYLKVLPYHVFVQNNPSVLR